MAELFKKVGVVRGMEMDVRVRRVFRHYSQRFLKALLSIFITVLDFRVLLPMDTLRSLLLASLWISRQNALEQR